MNNEDLIKQLEKLDLPQVNSSAHQTRLRRALLSSKHFDKRASLSLFSKKTVFSMGTFIVAFIVVGTVFGLNPQTSPDVAQAEALEIVQGVLRKVRLLPPEQRAAIEEQLGQGINEAFAEASKARDLRWVATEDLEVSFTELHESGALEDHKGAFPKVPGRIHAYKIIQLKERLAQDDATVEDFRRMKPEHAYGQLTPEQKDELRVMHEKIKEEVKLLQFTNKDGQVIQLGVDGDDVPVMKVIHQGGDINYTRPHRSRDGQGFSKPGSFWQKKN